MARFARRLVPLVLAVVALGLSSAPISRTPTIHAVAFGDSLIATGTTRDGWLEQNRVSLELQLEKPILLRSFPQPGATSGQILDRLRSDEALRQTIAASSLVVFDGGLNDFLYARGCGVDQNDRCLDEMVRNFEQNWASLIAEIRVLSPDAAIETMDIYYPVSRYDQLKGGFAALNSRLERMNRYIYESAADNGIAVAKVRVRFNGANGWDNPVVRGLILPDGVHPTNRGQNFIASAFREIEAEVVRAMAQGE